MVEVILEEWSVINVLPNKYQPPECQTLRIKGKVFGHSNHEDGTRIITSEILDAKDNLVQTLNTKYRLGKAHEDYKNWYRDNYGKELNENQPF